MLALVSIASLVASSIALDNGLGRRPQMGYNSWYDVMMSPSQALMESAADALISTGLHALGYQYVNVDDGWSIARAANGSIIPDPKFPDIIGMVNYIHSKGLLAGLYGDRGNETCGGRIGQYGMEVIDANTLASWGVDYWKEDSCGGSQDHSVAFAEYAAMRDALNASGRSIFFSLCGWEAWYAPVGSSLGNSYRIGPDDTNWAGVLVDIDAMAPLWPYSGPGGFNDPCLLLGADINGNEAQSEQQSRAQFSMWAILQAPMLLSQNIRNLSVSRLETYSNAEVIAVGQDEKGHQGQRWAGGPLSGAPDGNTPATLQPCASTAASEGIVRAVSSQQWQFNVSASNNFLSNVPSNQCMNVDDCGSNLIVFTCVTSGGTCCGADCYDNEVFTISAEDNTIRSAMSPNTCITQSGVGQQLTNAPCVPGNSDQVFTYNPKTYAITDKSGANCVSVGGASSGNRTNVWGRTLADGSYAVVFLNVDVTPLDIACDYDTCLSNTAWEPDQVLTVRDLWAHADLPNITASQGWTVPQVPADGGVAMYRFTPVWPQTP